MRTSNYIRHFTFAILCAAFCFTACGESGPECNNCTQTPFSGVWTGSAHFDTSRQVDGVGAGYSYTPSIVAREESGRLTLTAFGIDGDGSISTPVTGTSLAWAGISIVSIGNDACPNATVEYTSGTISMVSGSLRVHLSGVNHWCGTDYTAALDFTASKHEGLGVNHIDALNCDAVPTPPACLPSCEETGTCPTCSTFNVTVTNSLADGVIRTLDVEADVWLSWDAYWYQHTQPSARYVLMNDAPIYSPVPSIVGGPTSYSFQSVACVGAGGVFGLFPDEVVPLDSNGQAIRQPLPAYMTTVTAPSTFSTYDCNVNVGTYSGSPAIMATCAAR